MREGDSRFDPEDTKFETNRRIQSYGGTIIAIGGMILANFRPELALYGIGAALIGAGLVDPSSLLGIFKK